MGNTLNVCLYNTDPESGLDLEKAIRELNFVRLGAKADSPEALSSALRDESTNLVFFHLDPDTEAVVEVIEEVASQYPDLALIAISGQTHPQAILAPMRAGCDQFVCSPIDQADLALAVSRAASKHLLHQPRSRCICITGGSGGAGSTSIACNLALEIAHLTDRACALVDLNLQFGDIALNFDCEPKYSFHDLAVAGADLDRTILASALLVLPSKVAILSRPNAVEQEGDVTGETIQRVIPMLMLSYENVVIDLPRELEARTIAALTHADVVFIICQALVPSIRNTKRYYDALIHIGVPDERIKVILNREDKKNGRITVKDVEEIIKKPVFACIPNDYQFVARSIDFGRPIASLDLNNPVRAAIRQIARDVTTEPGTEPEKEIERRGFFKSLLSR